MQHSCRREGAGAGGADACMHGVARAVVVVNHSHPPTGLDALPPQHTHVRVQVHGAGAQAAQPLPPSLPPSLSVCLWPATRSGLAGPGQLHNAALHPDRQLPCTQSVCPAACHRHARRRPCMLPLCCAAARWCARTPMRTRCRRARASQTCAPRATSTRCVLAMGCAASMQARRRHAPCVHPLRCA